MPKPQTATNPFYVLLVVVGIAFVITAFAFFTMTIRESQGSDAAPSAIVHFLSRHGMTTLLVELVLLAIATFGAIGTDDYWSRRARASAAQEDPADSSESNSPSRPRS